MKLDNGLLTIEIAERGAELVSVTKHGHQYLWNANELYWNRHAPILFPIVGRMRDDKCRIGEYEYIIKQHGFARDSMFLTTGNPGELKLAQKPSKDIYPFDFDLFVRYELHGSQLKVTWKVINQGNKEMCFQIGAHPGFMLPDYDEAEAIHGYIQCYDAKGNIVSPVVLNHLDGGLRCSYGNPKALLNDKLVLAITNSTFVDDAILLEEGQVAYATLFDKYGHRLLSVSCPQAEAFGIWAPNKKGCPFVCIEPWCGIADKYNFSGDIFKRECIHSLAPNGTYRFEYSILLY